MSRTIAEANAAEDYASGRWCGECRWNVAENPLCCYGHASVCGTFNGPSFECDCQPGQERGSASPAGES